MKSQGLKSPPVEPDTDPRQGGRHRALILLGSGVLLALVGSLAVAALKTGKQPSPMADPHASGRHVALTIKEDYCRGSISSISSGIGAYGQFGFMTINCSGPSGDDITFGVFQSEQATDKAVAAMSRTNCQDNGQLSAVAAAVSGPRWIAFMSDARDGSSLEGVGGTRLPCTDERG